MDHKRYQNWMDVKVFYHLVDLLELFLEAETPQSFFQTVAEKVQFKSKSPQEIEHLKLLLLDLIKHLQCITAILKDYTRTPKISDYVLTYLLCMHLDDAKPIICEVPQRMTRNLVVHFSKKVNRLKACLIALSFYGKDYLDSRFSFALAGSVGKIRVLYNIVNRRFQRQYPFFARKLYMYNRGSFQHFKVTRRAKTAAEDKIFKVPPFVPRPVPTSTYYGEKYIPRSQPESRNVYPYQFISAYYRRKKKVCTGASVYPRLRRRQPKYLSPIAEKFPSILVKEDHEPPCADEGEQESEVAQEQGRDEEDKQLGQKQQGQKQQDQKQQEQKHEEEKQDEEEVAEEEEEAVVEEAGAKPRKKSMYYKYDNRRKLDFRVDKLHYAKKTSEPSVQVGPSTIQPPTYFPLPRTKRFNKTSITETTKNIMINIRKSGRKRSPHIDQEEIAKELLEMNEQYDYQSREQHLFDVFEQGPIPKAPTEGESDITEGLFGGNRGEMDELEGIERKLWVGTSKSSTEQPVQKGDFTLPTVYQGGIPVTYATTMRNAFNEMRKKQEECQRLMELIVAPSAEFEDALYKFRQEEERLHEEEIKIKHMEGLSSFQEAVDAKKKVLLLNAEKRKEYEAERVALEAELEALREMANRRIQELIEKTKLDQLKLKEVKQATLEEKQRNVKSMVEEREMRNLKMQAKLREEIAKKISLVKAEKIVSAINKTKAKMRKDHLARMCELSMKETQIKLEKLKADEAAKLARRQDSVRKMKEHQRNLLETAINIIETERARRKFINEQLSLRDRDNSITSVSSVNGLQTKKKQRDPHAERMAELERKTESIRLKTAALLRERRANKMF